MKKFDLRLFLGKWYEVARINNGFEPEMDKVTAQYSLNDNGTIQVINSGYIGERKRQIIGTAKTTDQSNLLKVSFFPGIYSDYKILAIGNSYEYALIGGELNTYLWILSRTPEISDNIFKELVSIAKEKGYRTDMIILTKQ